MIDMSLKSGNTKNMAKDGTIIGLNVTTDLIIGGCTRKKGNLGRKGNLGMKKGTNTGMMSVDSPLSLRKRLVQQINLKMRLKTKQMTRRLKLKTTKKVEKTLDS